MSKLTIIFMMLFASSIFINKVHSQDIMDPTTLNNKIMAGYQGWFAADGDGAGEGWRHWGGNPPSAESITIDFWPDMREYEPDELFPTNFFYADGTNAGLYSAYTPKTVDRHVKWMKDYAIDGVFVQRFIGNTLTLRDLRDRVLQNVRFASEKHGRVFANMYDMSGGNPNTLVDNVIDDWIHLVDDLKITESPNYIHHNGRPVLSIWGLGHREGITVQHATDIIQWLTVDAPEKYRVTLKGGIDNKWRSHSAEWQAVYEKFEVISPWAVGRYSDNNGADNFRKDYIEPDLVRTKSKGIDYMPVVFPGFSWWNLKDDATFNSKPRNGGKFLWRQFYNAMDAGCNMVYVAMYDEVDEGTAIFKLVENDEQLPTTGRLIPLDYDGYELPSDWYLRLTGEATKMLRGEIDLTSIIPLTATISDAKIVSQNVPTIMSPGATVSVSITVKNTGKTSWTKADGFHLGSQNTQDNTTWGVNRIELDDGETIATGENKTFAFDVIVPATDNVYNFRWRMIQEGVNWFGDLTENRLINVTDNPVFFDDCDALTSWNSSVSLILNSTEKQQGTNCLEFTGSNSNEFNKTFSAPYNFGISANNAVLQFWYFISAASKLDTQNKVEIGSAGKAGEDVYNWTLKGLSTGWNLISIKIKDAASNGVPDMNAINWFSINSIKTADVTTRIDEIQILDMNATAERYKLKVNNGSGSGLYNKNSSLNISADLATSGFKFDKWTVISGNPMISDPKLVNTSLTITDGDVEVSATYKSTMGYLDDCDELTGWQDASYLKLNSTDKKQGMACVEYTGDKSAEFKKIFPTPYKPEMEIDVAVLQFWYYVSDISVHESSNQVELGSAGKNDEDEFNWKLTNLKNGWNFISLEFSDASTMDNPDFNAINWFRIYHKKTGEVTTKIDAIKIVDKTNTSTRDINSVSTAPTVNIYPNPLSGNLLSIELNGFSNLNDAEIKIVNMLGQSVYSKNLYHNRHHTIELGSSINPGIYIVRIQSGRDVVNTSLIVR
jgi:hypothetical protein